MPVIVESGTTNIVVVRDAQQVGTVTQDTRVVTASASAPQPTSVTKDSRTVQVAAPGPQGPPGTAVGGASQRFTFSFGDASPSVLTTLQIAAEVLQVSLEITVPFNGVGASLSLGTPAQPDVLMAASQNAPGVVGVYETAPRTDLLVGDIIQLTLVPGAGATQGAGQLVLTLV